MSKPKRFYVSPSLVLTALAVTALIITDCQPQKQAGPPEKAGENNHDQQ